MYKDLLRYEITMDPDEDNPELKAGISLISNVSSPAVKIKGFAFHNTEHKKMIFTDDLKYRIAAPIMIPGEYYREDKDKNGKVLERYFVDFTPLIIENLTKDFMSGLTKRGEDVFNLEHRDQMLDSYILEMYLVDSTEKVDMIKQAYGMDIPVGSAFCVQQFNNKEQYLELVSKGQTGFSIEGFLGTRLKESNKHKQIKQSEMKRKQKFVAYKRFENQVMQAEDVIIVTEELTEGTAITIVEDTETGIESNTEYTGEIEVTIEGESQTVGIEAGVITSVVSTEPIEEAVAETEMAEEKPAEVETEEVVMQEEITEVSEDVAPVINLDEVYQMIAELVIRLDALESKNTQTPAPEMYEDEASKLMYSLQTFLRK